MSMTHQICIKIPVSLVMVLLKFYFKSFLYKFVCVCVREY